MDYKVCGVFDAKKEKYYFTLTDFEQSVSLNAVNQRGEDVACICIISKKTGKITRIGCVTNKLGFDLTWNGMVKVE